ncbi:MAG: ethanolamine ammonia-lyase reactivating factor EutA, partial [Candidatus Hodarchaeales archaeon]
IRQDFLSVGIDIGTSTSHLVFSRITIEKDYVSKTERYHISEREVLYKSPIHLTPLKNGLIDYQQLSKVLLDEYDNYGVSPSEIDTGAVIITGESAKRSNAEKILHVLSKDTGKFVIATAGPNLESILSAKGSGAVDRSRINQSTIMNIDVGGGTSNIAIIESGNIITTACINVGGRLLVINGKRITRTEKPIKHVAESLGINLVENQPLKDIITTKMRLSVKLASCLMEVIKQVNPISQLTEKLLQTEPLDYSGIIDEIIITGGIGEFIYNNNIPDFGDMGKELAQAILSELKEWNEVQLTKPAIDSPIRATVIGTGQYTLQVSGSTIFLSRNLIYPLYNLPVVPVRIDRSDVSIENVKSVVERSLKMFDIDQVQDDFILSFRDPVRTVYEKLAFFAKGIEKALFLRVEKRKPVFLVFDTDIGNSIGNVMIRETSIDSILSIDEVYLEEGDFIDIGEPLFEYKAVPVHVKTLAFLK